MERILLAALRAGQRFAWLAGADFTPLNIEHRTPCRADPLSEVHELFLPALRETARRIDDDIALAFALRSS